MTALMIIAGSCLAAAVVMALIIVRFRKERDSLRRRAERSAQELERLQRSFSRFAPPELVERIIEAGSLESGDRREVTVMFADIRDFTRISENLDPAVVIEALNGYFGEMSRVIRSHHGHVTRIMGDGIMSVFGALEQNPWHALDAVEAAAEMRRALQSYNRGLSERGFPELRFGIGIHCGTVVAGVVGSEELLEFTVMGDVVNVASRIEALTRRFDWDILITKQVRDRIGDRFELTEMEPVHLKGKTVPVTTWALTDSDMGSDYVNGRRQTQNGKILHRSSS